MKTAAWTDTLRSSFADAGSSPEMLDIIEANARYLPKGYEKGGKKNFMQWPVVDDFIIHVAADVIREHAPQVMFVHTGTFDSYRHAHGVFSSYLDEARANLDRYIGELMDACRAAGGEQRFRVQRINAVLLEYFAQECFAQGGRQLINQEMCIRDRHQTHLRNADPDLC